MQNTNHHHTLSPLWALSMALIVLLSSCIDDSFTSSPADQPTFSVDTLDMGTVFTAEQSATHRFTVYNRHDKGLNISNIALSGANAGIFRLNVDGMSGKTFNNIEIRANDSIFVFVSADIPEGDSATPQRVDANLDFTVNGVVSSVVISAAGQDIRRIKAQTLNADTRFSPGKPFQVIDSLVVGSGTTLTIDPGVVMLFHDNAKFIVRGTLIAEGTAQAPIKITGDRMGNVITDVSFDLMSRQWYGMEFMPESSGSRIAFAEVSNTTAGVTVYGDGQDIEAKRLTLINSRLRNSGDRVLSAIGASVEAYGCEFAEASYSLVYLAGGDHRFDQCTAANYYLFSAVTGAAWMLPELSDFEDYADFLPTKALVTNSITYGLGADVKPGDLTGKDVYFKRCLFKSRGEDDANFIDSLWDVDPLFYTVRNEYIFDYRLKPDSPAIGSSYTYLSEHPLATDYYGTPRRADLGAYAYKSIE